MIRYTLVVLALLACTSLHAQELAGIRFPKIKPLMPLPTPQPEPPPTERPLLEKGLLWVGENDEKFTLVTVPPDVLEIKIFEASEEKPFRTYSRFADGSGKYEWREYTGPFVAVINVPDNAVARVNNVTVLGIPAAVPDDSVISRWVIDAAGPTPVPVPPGPGPGPTPPGPTPPGPVPTGLAGEVRKWLQALPAGVYDRNKALAVGNNYLSVASQGADPARNSGWTLSTFTSNTKQLNQTAMTAADVVAWSPQFFGPLSEYSAAEYNRRGLQRTDAVGIAALWNDIGEAIKAGAP